MTGQQLKNSILQEAIEGRLVPQDPNDEPASVLLERIRAEKARLVKEKKIKKDKNESRIYRTEDGHWMEHFEDKNREDVCIDEEIPFDIPKGWEWCRMSSYLDVRDGTHDSPKYHDEGIPFVTSKNLKNGLIDFSTCNLISIKDHLKFSERSLVEDGDILFAMIGSIGNPVIVKKDREFSIKNVALFKRYSINTTFQPYIYYYLYLLQWELKKIASGGVQSFIGLNTFRTRLFPLPPLAEQHRIVEKIESLLPKVEAYGKAQEELEKLNEALPEQLKKSILQEAIEGRLVPQDPNDEPASVLLERIRAEKARLVKEKKIKKDKNESRIYRTDDGHWMEHFEDKSREDVCIDEEIPFDVPSGWEWCRVRELSESYIGLTYTPRDVSSDGWIVLRSSNIQNGKLDMTDIVRVNKTIPEKLQIRKNDIIICARNGSKKLVGKSAIVDNIIEPLTFGAFMAICRTEYYDYMYQYLQSPLFFEQLRKDSDTTTINQLTQKNFNGYLVPLPPLAEQHRIVEKIESLLPKIEKLKVKK